MDMLSIHVEHGLCHTLSLKDGDEMATVRNAFTCFAGNIGAKSIQVQESILRGKHMDRYVNCLEWFVPRLGAYFSEQSNRMSPTR